MTTTNVHYPIKTDTTAQTDFLIDPVAFAYDFGARMYDARLGIFTSIDPHASKYPSMSPYSAMANNPIIYVDKDGKENTFFIYISSDTKSSLFKQGLSEENIEKAIKSMLEIHGLDAKTIDIKFVSKPVAAKELDHSDTYIHITSRDNTKADNEVKSINEVDAKSEIKYDPKGPSTLGESAPEYASTTGIDIDVTKSAGKVISPLSPAYNQRRFIIINGGNLINAIDNLKNLDGKLTLISSTIVHEEIHGAGLEHNKLGQINGSDQKYMGTIFYPNDNPNIVAKNSKKGHAGLTKELKKTINTNGRPSDNRLKNKSKKSDNGQIIK